MKIFLVLLALNTIKYSHLVPLGGVISGGFEKHGGLAIGPAGSSQYAEGHVDGASGAGGAAGFSASFGGGGGGGADVVKTVTVEKEVVPVSHGYVNGAGGGGLGGSGIAGFSASFGGGLLGKHGHGGHAEVVSEKVLEVETEAPPPLQPAKKTVIERTFIPNYVEKRVQVPTYVEKTIRVPAYVEKTIKVPAAPTILEKTISQEDVPASAVQKEAEGKVKVEGGGNVQVYHKVKVRPHKFYHKEILTSGGGGGSGYVGGADYAGSAGYGGASGFGGAGGGGGFHAFASGNGGSLFDGIFNIPIQTLETVKGFLNNLSGGFSAEGGFSKGFRAY